MAKGSIITPDIDIMIAETLIEYPQWTGPQIQAEVVKRLGGKGPGISAIQKALATLRKAIKTEPAILEEPWSIAGSVVCDIPDDATNYLVKIRTMGFLKCKLMFTNREARWITRFRALAFGACHLIGLASRYARRERACKALGRPLFTMDLDKANIF